MSDRTVSISRVINAPIERTWRAWTKPEDLARWFTAEGGAKTEVLQMDVKLGGRVRLKFSGAAGEYTWTYVKIDKPKQLVFDILDFSLPQFLPDGVGGICNIEFEDLSGRARVTVSGELPDESMRKMTESGWGATLVKLNNYLKEN